MKRLGRSFARWRKDLEVKFKSPKEMYKNACDLTTKSAKLIGVHRFDPNYKRLNLGFIFLIIDFVFFLAFGIWSIADGWGNLINVTFSFVTISIGVQCGIKGLVFTSSIVSDLQQYNLNRFENAANFPGVRESLMKTAFYCKASVENLKRAYFLIGVFTILFSIGISAANRQFELPYGFYVPEVDRDTWSGYLVNLAYQTLQMLFSYVSILSSDLVLFNLITNAMGQLEVIFVYLDELQELSDENRIAKSPKLLKELIEIHAQHTQYMMKFDNLMKAGFFLNFGCLIAEAVSSLYVLTTVDEIWYPGFLFIECSIYQLGIACFLGSMLSSKNDQLICKIYNTSWFKLPIPEQKMLQLLLLQAQNPIVLTDGFTPINLDTFKEIIKNIYSYFTVLQRFN